MLDEKDQQRVEHQIRAAFAGVSRNGGVSWSEAGVIDDYGTDEERVAARQRDTDRSWEELVDDAAWLPDEGWQGFSFLDAIGFRYYLAPAMIRAVRTGQDPGMRFHLTLPDRTDDGHEWCLERWSLLNARQRSCIAAFLSHMAEWAVQEGEGCEFEGQWWRDALTSYWDTQKS